MSATVADFDTARFREIFEQIFNRWSALRICVEHGMGGRQSHATALEIMEYAFQYCTGNAKCTQSEIEELLEDVMDQEFQTICEDDSTREIAANLTRYMQMCREQKWDAIAAELAQLPACNRWLVPNFQVQRAPKRESDSDSSSDGDDDDDEMDDSPAEARGPTTRSAGRSSAAAAAAAAGGSMETEEAEEDGWTKVPTRRRH